MHDMDTPPFTERVLKEQSTDGDSFLALHRQRSARLQSINPDATRIWACHLLAKPDVWARYLHKSPATPENADTTAPPPATVISPIELVSATKIHAAIITAGAAESAAFIDTYALGPSYLNSS